MKGLLRVKIWDDTDHPIQEIRGSAKQIKQGVKDFFSKKHL